MRYCPSTRIDYDDDVDECVVGGGPLVEGSAREMFEDIPEDAWVELDLVSTLTHATHIVEALDEISIPCYIEAMYSGDVKVGYTANILVPDNMFEDALEVQQSLPAPVDDDDFFIDPDNDDF
ncbi:MAG TPA: hypothetical protein ENH10_06795 [Bacteroidetes bacterium]|nr:hypothetical protein BMS3Bbin04_00476 [bacterium BMS3Bbin04]HDO65725.1 hypothetical protein [Bacteroidota bacterium]HEX04850.1 hypothetical protein [Bacteroidota bacterium]